MQFMLVAIILVAGLTQAQTNQPSAPGSPQENRTQALSQSGTERIVKEVHHELVLLPYYGVFDNLAYRVSPDGTVTLDGPSGPSNFEVGCGKRSETHRGR